MTTCVMWRQGVSDKKFSCQFFFGDLRQTARSGTRSDNWGNSTSLVFCQEHAQADRSHQLKNLLLTFIQWKHTQIHCREWRNPGEQKRIYGASKKKIAFFFKLLQRVHTQRLEYAAHMSFIAHIWKVVLTTSPRLFCISFPASHSPASGGPVRQPRPTKNMEKPMESLTLSDPTRSTCGNTTALKTDRFGGWKNKLSLKPHESWIKAIFRDIR